MPFNSSLLSKVPDFNENGFVKLDLSLLTEVKSCSLLWLVMVDLVRSGFSKESLENVLKEVVVAEERRSCFSFVAEVA